MAQETLTNDLKAQIAAKRVVVVAGTGVSAAATGGQNVNELPVWGWMGLLKHGVWTLQQTHGLIDDRKAKLLIGLIEDGDIDLMISAGEQICTRLRGKAPGIYHRWLQDSVGKLKPSNPEIVKVLARLGGLVTTLNYDGVLEAVLKRQPVSWRAPPARLLR